MNEKKLNFEQTLAAAVPPDADFNTVLSKLLAVKSDFHEALARVIEPSLNAFLGEAPQQTADEKSTLVDSVMGGLNELGLSIRFPGTDEPASLRVDRNRGDNGRFELSQLDRHGGQRRMNCSSDLASAAFYPLKILASPSRYASWTEKLRLSRFDVETSRHRSSRTTK